MTQKKQDIVRNLKKKEGYNKEDMIRKFKRDEARSAHLKIIFGDAADEVI